jgi:IclR family transcriptional regulator, acetate operon repressor
VRTTEPIPATLRIMPGGRNQPLHIAPGAAYHVFTAPGGMLAPGDRPVEMIEEMKKAAPETPSVQSLDRGLMILEAVAKSNDPVPLGQLRQLLGLNRSSVFRLANTLRRRGFLANPNGRNDYVIGPSIWRLFRNYDWTMLVSFCRHHLKLLASQTGETAHLAVREGRQALFIDHQTSGNQIIAVSGRTGEFMPLHCTAHGKALLADCGVAELKAILGVEKLETHTPKTIGSIDELAKACARIKAQGFAVDEAELLEEVRCLAAPIRDKDGVIVAAIGISAPVARLSPSRLPGSARHVTAAARQISEVLSAEL